MKVSISLTDQSTKFIINNLYPLYLHDLSEIWGFKPNSYGVFEDNETMTLQEQNKVFDIWWEKKTVLYPYLIRVDDIPAGFALVATPPYTPHGNDYYLNEFFILRSYRGTGAAEMAAHQVFDCHRGGWELQSNPDEQANARAQAFWRRTLHKYTDGVFQENIEETHNDGRKLIFTFTNV